MRGEEKRKERTYEVLLVEDHPGDARLMREAWASCDFVRTNVVVLQDSCSVVPYLRREGAHQGSPVPDIILVDYHMPTDGGMALAAVRGDPALTHLPIIVLTGSDSPADLLDIYRRHANCCLKKPNDLEELLAVIDEVARHWLLRAMLPPKVPGGMAHGA